MNFKKAIRLLLIILIIVLFLTVLRSTYSKYVTSYDKQTGVGLLSWNIKLNNQKIIDNVTFTNTLSVVFEQNEHIADNVIAPTKRGTVDLILDSTGTQVPYQYDVQIVGADTGDIPTLDNVPDYKIYAYSINNSTPEQLQDGVQSIVGQILPANDITTPVITYVKLYVEWNDDVDNIMDNAADVAVSKLDQPYGTIPIRSKRNANRFLIYK